jgi:hypothetical protein
VYPVDTLAGRVRVVGFVATVAMLLACFLKAVYVGAGRVPRGWTKPQDDRSQLQFCQACDECVADVGGATEEGRAYTALPRYKAPRSHHCRTWCVGSAGGVGPAGCLLPTGRRRRRSGGCMKKLDHHWYGVRRAGGRRGRARGGH